MNVIDDSKLQVALQGVVGDSTQALVKEVIPALAAIADASINKITADLGDALADITSERQEAVADLHALLDRLNGATLTTVLNLPKKG